jgi:hypothetical protein
MTTRPVFATLCGLALATLSAAAHAAAAPLEPLTPILPPGLQIDAAVGVAVLSTMRGASGPSADDAGGLALTLGCAVGGRAGAFAGGVNVDAVTTVFDQNEFYGGAHAGYVHVATHRATEWSVLPEAGVHLVTNIGNGLFDSASSPRVRLPYAGLRLGYLRERGPRRADFGLWLFLRADLARQTVVAQTTSIFGAKESVSYDVGGLATGVAFRAQFGD